MRVCIPVESLNEGGGYYFIRLLWEYLDRNGVPWTNRLSDDYDVLFASGWLVAFENVRAAKMRLSRLRVVHRVDGSARDYGRFDSADVIQARVNLLADATIFQSDYGRYATREKFRVVLQDGPVIRNPVDTKLFRSDGESADIPGEMRVLNASWSTNRQKGTWQIPILAERHPGVTFVLCGRYPDLPDLPNVRHLGHLDSPALARAMRGCDVFLDLTENECCSNVTLQAMASGLPVIHKGSGGTPELVGEAGAVMRSDLSDFRPVLNDVLRRRDRLSALALERVRACFAPDVVFPRYMNVLDGASRRPLPTLGTYLGAVLRGCPLTVYPFWQYPFRRSWRLVVGDRERR
ncbi:MAG: glycosyltransferase family 4 protein [Planctomycetota bacterium]